MALEVTVNGVAYPCHPTMGAMLRFKKETGKEITEIQAESLTDLCTYLYCCVASASAAAHKNFDLSLMEFADSIAPEDLAKWAQSMQGNNAAESAKGGKKK